ncbi:transcription elongation factor GreA [Patescibacteria group bacterium]
MNNNHQVNLTKEGYEELVSELKELQDNKLPKAINRVALARSFGDLSENSEYHSAREDLAFVEGKVQELETLVARAKIVKISKSKTKVSVGSKVTVKANGDTHTYDIVGEYEADPIKKKISHDSPLGKALVGRKVGEEAEFDAPVGKVIYTIDKIH